MQILTARVAGCAEDLLAARANLTRVGVPARAVQ